MTEVSSTTRSASSEISRRGPGGSAPFRGAGRASTQTLLTDVDGAGQTTSQVRRTTLPSGLRIVTEEMVGARSVAVGVWVGVGSSHERASQHGCSHFLEHLLFKGTRGRSAFDISIALDAVGGEFNAFTAKEYTCFHARILDVDLPMAIDVLGDMMTDSRITGQDVEAERDVILDEIAMHDDDPDDVVHNLFAAQAWGASSPLGRGIAGTAESITAMSADQVRRFYRRHYRPDNMVVSVAGSLDHASVVRAVKQAFARNDFLTRDHGPSAALAPRRTPPAVFAGESSATAPFEQVNLVLGMKGLTRDDDRRFALGVLNTTLGGGPSSRLFQEVRERRGLAYSVFSFAMHHIDSGLVGVSVGCLPAKRDEVLSVVRGELAKVAAEGITAIELERGKGQLRGGLVLGLEDCESRMSRIGKSTLIGEELLGIDHVLSRIDQVTLAEVRDLAADLFGQPEILAVVGPA
ncbi:pitrilysin family protein [Nocardioides salsibiostraticola]